jgi:soluble lytic murein transglycosylase-like protein
MQSGRTTIMWCSTRWRFTGRFVVAALAASAFAPAVAQRTEPALLDAVTCAALRGGEDRAAAKFTLGRQACGMPAAPVPGPVRPAAQAQQLYLYDRDAAEPRTPDSAASAAVGGANGGRGAKRAAQRQVSRGNPSSPGSKIGIGLAHGKWSAALGRAVGLAPEIQRVAVAYSLDPLLLHAIARVESGHNAAAVSHAGALGVMQVMPATASRFGVNDASTLHEATVNLRVSASYLNILQARFPGDLRLVLAAYNAGEGAVERYGRRVPPYSETQDYVKKVLLEYARLTSAAKRVAQQGTEAGL